MDRAPYRAPSDSDDCISALILSLHSGWTSIRDILKPFGLMFEADLVGGRVMVNRQNIDTVKITARPFGRLLGIAPFCGDNVFTTCTKL